MEPDFIPMYDDMNQGIAPLVNDSIDFNTTGRVILPEPRQVLGNVIRNQAIEYAGKKLGINQLGQVLGLGQYLGNVFGMGLGLNPVSVGIGALAGGIRNRFNAYRQVKRDQRARKEAAARGLAKQRAAATQAMTSNQAYSGEGGNSGSISNAQAAANREGRRGGQYG